MSIPTSIAVDEIEYNGTSVPVGGNRVISTENADGTQNLSIVDGGTVVISSENQDGTQDLSIIEGGASVSLQAKTATPSSSQQVVEAGTGYNGLSTVVVEGDANLVAENIKDGVEIFGVEGTLDPEPTLQSKSVTPSTSQQLVTADSDYDGLDVVTVNAMPSGSLSTPTLNVSTGVVTAQIGTSGYLDSGTSKTLSLSTVSAKTVTPGTSTQTAVGIGLFTTGAVMVAGDSNLIANNIKEDVSIFGVTGTHSNPVTGYITSSGWVSSVTITDAIDKENIMITLMGLPSSTYILVLAWSINGDNYVAYTKDTSSRISRAAGTVSWNSESGTLTITDSGYTFYSGEDYMYVAW